LSIQLEHHIIFEISFIYFLFTDPIIIGKISGYFDPNYGLFVRAYESSLLIVIIITGTLFSRETIKAEDKETKLKGYFILVAIYLFIIGGVLDIIALLNFPTSESIILMVIARAVLISCAIEFYIGLTMPKRIRKFILKE